MIEIDFPLLKEKLINLPNKFKFTPLMCVCFRGYLTKGGAKDAEVARIDIVNTLLDAGAETMYSTPDTKMTATHWAAYRKDAAVVNALLLKGANHFHFSHMNRLPIDVAGSSRAFDVVDEFLKNYYESVSINPNQVIHDSLPALQSAGNDDR